jgi:hypothetical protein
MRARSVVQCIATGAVILGVASYVSYAGLTWLRWGRIKPARRPVRRNDEADSMLDRFMPAYEAVERHHIRVAAPAAIAFDAACDLNMLQSPIIRAIFRAREQILGSSPQAAEVPQTLLAMVKATGWSVLEEDPGREVVVGTVTQPWNADVVFHAIPAEQFQCFNEPGWVKIAFTLRADAIGSTDSVARTETRVATTDLIARQRFRRYWAFFLPGISLIRRIGLRLVKNEAERRVRARLLPAVTG